MDKVELTNQLETWLEGFLKKHYGKEYSKIEIIKPAQDLRLINDASIRTIDGSNSWEFKPDLVGVLSDGKVTQVVFVNRSTSSISLKEIGEMHCYAQLAKPMLAFVVSPSAASNEVNGILLDKSLERRILDYNANYPIFVLGWDKETKSVNKNAVTPFEHRELFG